MGVSVHMLHNSPLRYPGGKAKLSNFFQRVIESNNLNDGIYLEPYAGGAGIGLFLLYNEYVKKIIINDLNKSIYSFWYSVINHNDEFCHQIEDTPLTIEEWKRQKEIQESSSSILELGFSTFYLNRTNHSGIINGGVIGGLEQKGKWGISSRYNKNDLIERIRMVKRYSDRISIYNEDAIDFLTSKVNNFPKKSLIYIDPPYYAKGNNLYQDDYKKDDHFKLSRQIQLIDAYWILTYDFHDDIRSYYKKFRQREYSLNYSASKRIKGKELMIFSHSLKIPRGSII
jgi:DNA adenine methylase